MKLESTHIVQISANISTTSKPGIAPPSIYVPLYLGVGVTTVDSDHAECQTLTSAFILRRALV